MEANWLCIQAGISLVYLLYFFGITRLKNSLSSTPTLSEFKPFVSVLIAAKNERLQLEKNLTFFLSQNYFLNGNINFEVIVINDHSTDDTKLFIENLQQKHKHLKFIDFKENSTSSKKKALTKGIEAALGEYLLFSDADCKPVSDKWIKYMISHLKEKSIVLGYGGFYENESWINKVHAYETLLTAFQYGSFAMNLSPYMGVGRNMSYKKSVFIENKGFKAHEHIASGDDDLFIQANASKENTSLCFSKATFTISEAPNTWKDWWKQKTRHLTTAYHYKPIHQYLLSGIALLRLLFWGVSLLVLTIFFHWLHLFSFLILWFLIIQLMKKPTKHFQQQRLQFLLPILDLNLLLFHLILLFSSRKTKTTSWK